MRRILVDFARCRGYQKRGAGAHRLSLEKSPDIFERADPDLGALDDALNALAAIDQRKSRVVELRFFGGLTAEETAEVLKVSPDTILRDWKLAKPRSSVITSFVKQLSFVSVVFGHLNSVWSGSPHETSFFVACGGARSYSLEITAYAAQKERKLR
jgi:hypothetical protein